MHSLSAAGFRNVWILSVSSALAGSIIPLMILAGSLAGTYLAPSAGWATAPIALMVTGTAVAAIPVTQLMRALGRKRGLFSFMFTAVGACGLAILALQLQSFTLFCITAFILGFCNAAILQTRFAAMEAVAAEHSSTAASLVLAGGIIAAFVGPELALIGRELTQVEYQGSFVLAALCILLGALLLSFYQPAPITDTITAQATTATHQLLRNPSLCLAIASGAIAYVVMSFVMTGTPISMHHFHGHSLVDTKWVIQSHIAAMFLPSFLAPLLFRYISIIGMMMLGLACYCATIAIGFSDTSVSGFWLQLVLLGVGWNFMFVAGTTLLPTTHSEADRFKVQGINDFTVFSLQAVAALSAGWVINLISWQQMLLGCLLPILLMLAIMLWERSRRQDIGQGAQN
ncbi:MAG: MFS transporter [Porticoccaceae bacterium]